MVEKKINQGTIVSFFLDMLEDYMDRVYGRRKRSVFGELPDCIVEIGPGPGANLRYYRPGTKLIAIEPDSKKHPRLRANADHHDIDIDIRTMRGEDLDLPNESVEAVIGTLVLCTVDDPKQVVSQVLRVLEPGGRYIFLEHIAALRGTRLRILQNYLYKPWHWLFEGCSLNRNTHAILLQSGFTSVDMDCFMLRPSFLPVTPHIFGQAIK